MRGSRPLGVRPRRHVWPQGRRCRRQPARGRLPPLSARLGSPSAGGLGPVPALRQTPCRWRQRASHRDEPARRRRPRDQPYKRCASSNVTTTGSWPRRPPSLGRRPGRHSLRGQGHGRSSRSQSGRRCPTAHTGRPRRLQCAMPNGSRPGFRTPRTAPSVSSGQGRSNKSMTSSCNTLAACAQAASMPLPRFAEKRCPPAMTTMSAVDVPGAPAGRTSPKLGSRPTSMAGIPGTDRSTRNRACRKCIARSRPTPVQSSAVSRLCCTD